MSQRFYLFKQDIFFILFLNRSLDLKCGEEGDDGAVGWQALTKGLDEQRLSCNCGHEVV